MKERNENQRRHARVVTKLHVEKLLEIRIYKKKCSDS